MNLEEGCLLAAESAAARCARPAAARQPAAVWQAPHLEAQTPLARRRVGPGGMPHLLGDRLVGTSMLAATRTERCTGA